MLWRLLFAWALERDTLDDYDKDDDNNDDNKKGKERKKRRNKKKNCCRSEASEASEAEQGQRCAIEHSNHLDIYTDTWDMRISRIILNLFL